LLRTKEQLKKDCPLPDRKEFIVYSHLTDCQKALYYHFLTSAAESLKSDFSKMESLGILSSLRKICYHPYLFYAFNNKSSYFGYKNKVVDPKTGN
jgi:SNF2 family DNA or RNA helicase